MNLEIGSKKRFSEFISNLNDKDKIALISHTDLDGITAAKVTNEVIDADIVIFINYEELAQPLVEKLKENGITKVIFTDLYIKDPDFLSSLEKFAEILILDHHLADRDWNSEKITFIKGETGYCAGYLCYYLFSEIKDLEKLDWLVACSCISDYCHIKTSDWLTKIFAKYNDSFQIEGTYVRKSGPIWDLQYILSLSIIYFKDKNLNEVFNSIRYGFGDIGKLSDHAKEVKDEVDKIVSLYEKDREKFEEGYLYSFAPKFGCGSIVSSILSGKNIHEVIITLRPDPDEDIYHVSARRQDKKQNMSDFLRNLVKDFPNSDAGGHVPAAGGHFPISHLPEFKKRLGIK